MKLVVNKNQLPTQPENFLRQAGYGFIQDRRHGTQSFVRRLGSYHYPRLHMYIERNGEQVIFNLHLDQKQASYEGSHAHSGEYDSPIVRDEIARLQSLVVYHLDKQSKTEASGKSLEERMGNGSYDKDVEVKKKGWLRRLFG